MLRGRLFALKLVLFCHALFVLESAYANEWTIEFHIAADSTKDAAIVNMAMSSGANELYEDGLLIAKWIPVAKTKISDISAHSNLVTRKDRLGKLQLLVLIGGNDVTLDDVYRLEMVHDGYGKMALEVQFNDIGAKKLMELTSKNRDRYLAQIINSSVHAVPQIRSGVSTHAMVTGLNPEMIRKMLVYTNLVGMKFVRINMCRDHHLAWIGELFDRYEKKFDGKRPSTLKELVGTKELWAPRFPRSRLLLRPIMIDYPELLTCPGTWEKEKEYSYVYRGLDLPVDAPTDMIIAYDRIGNHEGWQNVLFSKYKIFFNIDNKPVNEQVYKNTCLKYLESYKPGVLIIVWQTNNTKRIIDTNLMDEAQFHTICKKIRKDYISGVLRVDSISRIWVREINKCYAGKVRVRSLDPEDFEKAIQRDNELRKELGLPTKPPLD